MAKARGFTAIISKKKAATPDSQPQAYSGCYLKGKGQLRRLLEEGRSLKQKQIASALQAMEIKAKNKSWK